MTSATAILEGLPTLKGELPAASANDLTLMVCAGPAQIDRTVFSTLSGIREFELAARIHMHVPGAGPEMRAQLTLWSAAHPALNLSLTWDEWDTEPASAGHAEAVGLVRLFQIAGLTRGRMAYAQPIADVALPLDLEDQLRRVPVAAPLDKNTGFVLGIDGSDRSLSVIAAMARPLTDRLRAGTIKRDDARTALHTVISAARQKSPAAIGHIGPTKEKDASRTAADDPIAALWPQSDGLKVLLLQPDLALPFKSPDLVADPVRRQDGSPFLVGAHGALRQSWRECFRQLETALTARGHRSVRIERPGSEITAELADAAGADVVILPHRQRFQCPGLRTPALFLMQIAHRWMFTLDEDGWGAGAAAYPYDGFKDSPDDSGVYERYRTALTSTNDSKFGQPDRKSRADLVAEDILPAEPYLFFPCQIPDDEVVRFFCDVPELDAITAVTEWATKQRVHVVFKAHPAAPETSVSFKAVANTAFTHWADASVHDLIEHSEAVVTLNSGVGHEAILHGKPVMMFGRSEYDCLAIVTALNDLDTAYKRIKAWDTSSQLRTYRKFYHWFTRDMAIDLQDESARNAALTRVVDRIERMV